MAISARQLIGIANNSYIPPGGDEGQVLAKNSNIDFDVDWQLGGGAGVTAYSTISELPLTNNDAGALAFVSATNRLYIWNGTGWFNIALINTNPTITQGPQSSYLFSSNGTPIVITLLASDPEGIPITWSYQVTSGSLGDTATIEQDNNVFTITPSTSDEDTGVFGVTFTASDGINIATAISSFSLAFSAADAFYNQSIVLTTSSTNNGTNNVFVDSSTNNFTVTRNGNATQGTFSPFSPAGWSGFFDGTGDYLTLANNAAFSMGTGNFTIEFWIYQSVRDSIRQILDIADGNSAGRLILWIDTGGTLLNLGSSGVQRHSTAGGAIVLNSWIHVALVRSAGTTKFYINGTQSGTDYTDSTNYTCTTGSVHLGINSDGGTYPFNGYMSNVRIVKGIAVYTATFTPPTAPLTAISGTSLLTLQDNRFVDRSANNFAITRFGDTRVTTFSPFLPTVQYEPATYGGSAYFDGTGDYLTVGSSTAVNFGTSDYTIEFFVFFSSLKNYIALFDCRPTTRGVQWFVGVNGDVYFDVKDGDTTQIMRISGGNGTVRAGEWTHMAVCRSGTTTTLYVKGAVIASNTSDSNSYTSANNRPVIGSNYSGSDNLTGYMSDIRVVKGTAVYTAAFTPPTAPVTAVANTSLLLNSTNASIYDETGKVVVETVGNAKVSTSVVKYGSTSMSFDGNGDWLVIPDDPNINLGSGDFTLEFWVYFNVVNAEMALISKGWTSSVNFASYLIYMTNAGSVRFLSSSNGSGWDIANEKVITQAIAQTWTHIAVTRSGSTFRAFVNGVINDSFTFTSTAALLNSSAQKLLIGGRDQGNNTMNGNLQDLRITKGRARYTANFTPPTAQLGYNNAE
jgi:hypothetical protein